MPVHLPSLMPRVGPRLPGGATLRFVAFLLFLLFAAGIWLFTVLGSAAKPDQAEVKKFEQLPPRLDIGFLEKPPFSSDLEQFGERPKPNEGGRDNPFQP